MDKSNDDKGKSLVKFPNTSSSGKRSRDNKCFKCLGFGHMVTQYPNQHVIVARSGCLKNKGASD